MRVPAPLAFAVMLAGTVTACNPIAKQDVGATSPTGGGAIPAVEEVFTLVGTEPFWGGTIRGGQLTYATPETQAGETIAVKRFAGNNGLGFSGLLDGAPLDLTVTPGNCSDGMSDRSYPYTVTLRIAAEQREGCAWSDRKPFSGPEHP